MNRNKFSYINNEYTGEWSYCTECNVNALVRSYLLAGVSNYELVLVGKYSHVILAVLFGVHLRSSDEVQLQVIVFR